MANIGDLFIVFFLPQIVMVVSLNGATGQPAASPVATGSKQGQGHVRTRHRKATELTAPEITLNSILAGRQLVQVMSCMT